MKRTKKIAASVLAALLAFSMLTACGGQPPAGGDAGSGAGNNGSSSNEPDPGTKPGTGDTDETVDISKLTSRAAKYFARQGATGKTRYIRYYDKIAGWEHIEACDGTRRYLYGPARNSEGQDVMLTQVLDVNQQLIYEYAASDPNKVLEAKNDQVSEYAVSNVAYLPYQLSLFSAVEAEPMTIDGIEYYCEKEQQGHCYYCFEKSDTEGLNLRYIVEKSEYSPTWIYEIREVRPTFDPELMRIPEGYERYDINYNGTTNRTYVGTTGKDTYPD